MSRSRDKSSLPQAFGEDVPLKAWRRVFQHVLRHTPQINLFDGKRDMRSNLLAVEESSTPRRIIIDPLLPDHSREILHNRTEMLMRLHYFEAGLHHRVSIQVRLRKRGTFRGYPSLEVELIEPLRKVSNLYLVFEKGKDPVFLEIPIAGASPEVRVVDFNTNHLAEHTRIFGKFLPETTRLDGMRVQIVNLIEGLERLQKGKELEGQQSDIDKMVNDPQEALPLNGEDQEEVLDEKDMAGDPGAEEEVQQPTRMGYTALMLMKNSRLRQVWIGHMGRFGIACRTFASFEEAGPRAFQDVDLLVFDVEQGKHHALDLIRMLQRKKLIDRLPFILIGARAESARLDDWADLGAGLFLRPNAPEDWLERRVRRWMRTQLKEMRDRRNARIQADEEDMEPVKDETEQPPAESKEDLAKRVPRRLRETVKAISEQKVESESELPIVLIAGDDKDSVELLRERLSGYSFRLEVTWDTRKAVAYARGMQPNLIILDITLPILYGLGLLRTFRQEATTAATPIILLASYGEREQVQEALKLNISDYIIKPYDPRHLIKRIKTLLQSP